jgi:hypothetical protein
MQHAVYLQLLKILFHGHQSKLVKLYISNLKTLGTGKIISSLRAFRFFSFHTLELQFYCKGSSLSFKATFKMKSDIWEILQDAVWESQCYNITGFHFTVCNFHFVNKCHCCLFVCSLFNDTFSAACLKKNILLLYWKTDITQLQNLYCSQ